MMSSSDGWLTMKNTACNRKFMLTVTSTHLHDAAQVLDVHALCLNDLHDNTVHIGQLWVGRHGVCDDRRGRAVMGFTACLPVGSGNVVVQLVDDHAGVLPLLPAAPGTCLFSSAFSWAQL